MAISPRLQLRQVQALTMTPQLLQSIRLLQLGQQELAEFLAGESEKNPFLIVESVPTAFASGAGAGAHGGQSSGSVSGSPGVQSQATSRGSTTRNRADGDLQSLEARLAEEETLSAHLRAQIAGKFVDQADRAAADAVIDSLDEDGYLRRPLDEIAAQIGVSGSLVGAVLLVIQQLDPPGIAARNLAECLELQLRDRDRFDPCMKALLANLDLLARRDFAALRKTCAVDAEDLAEMIAELRALDPRPGLRFAIGPAPAVTPDVIVGPAPDGGWIVELNAAAMPRVLVDRQYYSRIGRGRAGPAEKIFVADCLQSASWIVRSLEQRAATMLKVATEIVKRQDAFFVEGVEHLKPLTLKTVADAIKMHESTVSRVTANKYMATHRGLFEMKYFFATAISATDGDAAHSGAAVRHRIRQLIEAENADAVLSDDAIVGELRRAGVEIARRTVAKYREAMRIPSSAQRRREKRIRLKMREPHLGVPLNA